MKKAFVGTLNMVKVLAVKEVLEPFGYEVIPYEVDSKVSAQPKSDEETLHGAFNRAQNICQNGLRIGLEAGVEFTDGDLFLTNFGVLIDEENHIYKAGGTRIVLPNEIKKLIMEDGLELSDAMETYFKTVDIKHKEGAIGYFTNNLVVRKDIFIHIMKLLYGQYLFQEESK